MTSSALSVFQGGSPSLFSSFANPPNAARPMFRWWWPHGLVDTTEIAAEVNQMANAGFGGAEIQDVHHSISDASVLDPEGHGWGTLPWIDAVTTALETANKRNFQIDIAIGPCWPAAVPSITPDSEGAAKELVHGRAALQGGSRYVDVVPAPFQPAASAVTVETFLWLQAWRIDSGSSPTAKTVVLNHDSMIDLTSNVTSGRIDWTAPPGNATWMLLSYYMRGSGQLPEAGPHTTPTSFVIDHFSEAGSNAITTYWDSHILSNHLRDLFRKNGGSLFEDSLELEATTFWTPSLKDEFEKQMSYPITGILPAIVREKEKQIFTFDDADIARGALNDYWTVLSQLYIDHHVNIIKEWAHRLGMTLRVQPYGLQTDAMAAAAALDIGEGESLGFKNLDDFRSLAGGSNMALHEAVSCEAAAFTNGAYATSWNKVVRTMNPIMAAGVNKNVFHGFSYSSAPTAEWPGFAAFSPYHGAVGYAESWGPRQPQWKHAADISAYFGRIQLIMRRGVARHDVGFLRQKGYVGSGFGASYFSADGMRRGWSLNFLAPSLLDLPTAYVRSGRFAPDAINVGLIAFEGDAFASTAPVLSVDTARKLNEYADQGLKILVVGNWTATRAYGLSEFSQSSDVRKLVYRLLTNGNVVNVATRDDIPAGITALGVSTLVQHDSSSLLHLQRDDGLSSHYLFTAGSTATSTEAVDQEITLPRRSKTAVPVVLNPWTGESKKLALWNELGDDRISIRIKLLPGQTTLISIVPDIPGPSSFQPHAIATSADAIFYDASSKELKIRAFAAGTYTTTLNTGRVIESTIASVPEVFQLTSWRLSVSSYTPGPVPNTTTLSTITLSLASPLPPWSSLPLLTNVSGIGTYTSTFTLPPSWSSSSSHQLGGSGAILTLPSPILGSFRITVNGQRLPPADQTSLEHDLGAFLRTDGSRRNEISIEVATPLLNALRVARPEVFGSVARQEYGIVGVLRLVPYREVVVV